MSHLSAKLQAVTLTHERMTEYEPTMGRKPRAVPLVIQVAAKLVASIMMLIMVALICGLFFPRPHLLAYALVNNTGEDQLIVYDSQRQMGHPLLRVHHMGTIRWTPDGNGLLVAQEDGDSVEWHVLEMDGQRRNLRVWEWLGTNALPSPDWRQLVNTRTQRLLLFDPLANPDGYTTLINGDSLTVRELVWSPDGQRLGVIMQAEDSNSENRQVAVVNVDSGGFEFMFPAPAIYVQLRWSADSTRLAYIKTPDEIRIADIANGSTEETVLRHEGANVNALAWSPDGTRLVYAVRQGELYHVNLQTGERQRIHGETLGADTRLDWSPDGRWLAVSTGSLVNHTLHVVDTHTWRWRMVEDQFPSNMFIQWRTV